MDWAYRGDDIAVSVLARGQVLEGGRWFGDGVTDLGDGQAVLSGDWQRGTRRIEVMSTDVYSLGGHWSNCRRE